MQEMGMVLPEISRASRAHQYEIKTTNRKLRMCGVVVACVDFRWTSVTNVDGADTPQMCLIRPRFDSWLIFNFFVFLLSFCEHFAVLGLCGDGRQQLSCLLSRERSRLVPNYEYPSQSSQRPCRMATSRRDHVGVSELCTPRTKRS